VMRVSHIFPVRPLLVPANVQLLLTPLSNSRPTLGCRTLSCVTLRCGTASYANEALSFQTRTRVSFPTSSVHCKVYNSQSVGWQPKPLRSGVENRQKDYSIGRWFLAPDFSYRVHLLPRLRRLAF